MSMLSSFIPVPVHTLLPATGALISGIIAQAYAAPPVVHIGIAIAWASIYAYRRSWIPLGIVCASYLLGVTTYQIQDDRHRAQCTVADRTACDIIATVADVSSINQGYFTHKAMLHLHEVRTAHAWHPQTGTMLLYYRHCPAIQRANTLHIQHIKMNTQVLDRFFCKEDICACAFVETPLCTVLDHHKTPMHAMRDIRDQIVSTIEHKCTPLTAALFTTIFMGNSQVHQQENIRALFARWGISHHLARSGLHLVIFIALLGLLLSLLPLSWRMRQVTLLALVSLYIALSWVSISCTRAFIMFLLYTVCNILLLPIQVLHIVLLTTYLVLVYNPSQLFFLDFQLSFGLTAALAWMGHVHRVRKNTSVQL